MDWRIRFPAAYRQHPKFAELERLVESITNHEAMEVREKHVLDNMIRASLAFTVCFYANLLVLAYNTLGDLLKNRSPFGVQEEMARLHFVLDLAAGELAASYPPSRRCRYGPHYVPMLEAAQQAGVDTTQVERFVAFEGQTYTFRSREMLTDTTFCPELSDYLAYSNHCTKVPWMCMATIILREITLSGNFHRIVEHLPDEERLAGFRLFLTSHIELDEGEHAGLAEGILAEYSDEDEIGLILMTMIEFYTNRRAVYDACLREEPIY